MGENKLKIPKTRKQVKLWVHPEGLVIGSLFVREHSIHHAGNEEPHEVLNQDVPFIVLYREEPSELRFYNRKSIIRVEYEQSDSSSNPGLQIMPCRLTMMDGSVLEGEIREALPPEHSRLFDYLNQDNTRFIKMYMDDNQIFLVNKSYINHVTTMHTGR